MKTVEDVKVFEHRLVSERGFDEVINEGLADGMDLETAFLMLNIIYKQTYGIWRYSSYDSYRITRSRRIKRRRNSVT